MGRVSRSEARLRRKRRVRKRVRGTPQRPRLCVFRSARHIYAQVIDDVTGRTLAAASSVSKELAETLGGRGGNRQAAVKVGQTVGERALALGVKKIVFDRNGFLYHGRVKALAEGARQVGLEF